MRTKRIVRLHQPAPVRDPGSVTAGYVTLVLLLTGSALVMWLGW